MLPWVTILKGKRYILKEIFLLSLGSTHKEKGSPLKGKDSFPLTVESRLLSFNC